MYGFEVSAPDDAGRVTLAATKTFESEILLKDVTETAVLKTYRAGDYDEATSYLDPRTDALSDARALIYEWGRADLDHGMGSALKLAQGYGFKSDRLFTEGPPDTFIPAEDARSIEAIQAERDWERDAEIFGMGGYKVPLPEDTIHAREVGRYGADADLPPGQFYAVTVREAESVFVVEGLKAWLDRDSGEAQRDVVTLGIEDNRDDAAALANTVAEAATVPERLERMTALANDFAGRNNPHVELLGLATHQQALFTGGPPDPGVKPPPASNVAAQPYSRTIGEAAYNLPLEDGQAYEFRARPIPELQTEVAGFGADALAVETVKHWQENGKPQQEVVTLGLLYDQAEARREVDSYVDLAEREGIQAAMSRAAMMADIQNYPIMIERAEELNLHPNENVRFGNMFQRGPDDPFLSERDIHFAERQYAADHPPHHRLSLEVVPVQDESGQALGHSVLALDAAWDHDETSRELDDAQSVAAYEVAQFESREGADLYRQSLADYMGKRDLEPEGTDISGAVDFVKAASETNGHGERWLAPWDIAQLAKGEWTLQHSADDFHPMTVETASVDIVAEVSVPDMEL
jgi:hypothetical protein